jgi:hypothetical protein
VPWPLARVTIHQNSTHPTGDAPAPSPYKRTRSQASSAISEDDEDNESEEEDNETLSISSDSKITSPSRITPAIEFTSLTESQLCLEVIDAD